MGFRVSETPRFVDTGNCRGSPYLTGSRIETDRSERSLSDVGVSAMFRVWWRV